VRILVETSGGGGIVLVGAIALIAGGNGTISAAAVAVIVTLAVVIALAIGGLVALLVYRARQVRPHFTYRAEPVTEIRASRADLPAQTLQDLGEFAPPAIEAPAVRLHPDQLAELAAILRHQQ
jgi:hypothetical protein